jgi:hypothetical protein
METAGRVRFFHQKFTQHQVCGMELGFRDGAKGGIRICVLLCIFTYSCMYFSSRKRTHSGSGGQVRVYVILRWDLN